MKKNLLVSLAIFIKDINEFSFKLWTQVRLEEGSLYGKLEFPGGKIELGETPKEACIREVLEEVEVELTSNDYLSLFKIQDYSFENKNISLHVFISNFTNIPESKGQWLELNYNDQSKNLEGRIPAINHVIIDELAVYLKKQFDAGCVDQLWQR